VDIELLVNDQEFSLTESESNDGTFFWNISPALPVSDLCRIRISASDGSISDESDDDFTISNQSSGEDFVIISEYVEGSGYHKAIEIFNGSPAPLDLEGYSLRKQTNGGGSFGNELFLNGSIAPWDVFVICYDNNGVNDLTDQVFIDMQTSSYCLAFNGNDAVALYQNGDMIDLIGVVNSSSDWGKDMTLVRNDNISLPSTSYNPDHWTEFPQDTFDFLGFHDYESTIYYGDVDGNGSIDAYDASLILQFVVLLSSNWESWQVNAADVDGSLMIDCYDASLILRYINGIIDCFPIQQ
jgi:hypothetical protein